MTVICNLYTAFVLSNVISLFLFCCCVGNLQWESVFPCFLVCFFLLVFYSLKDIAGGQFFLVYMFVLFSVFSKFECCMKMSCIGCIGVCGLRRKCKDQRLKFGLVLSFLQCVKTDCRFVFFVVTIIVRVLMCGVVGQCGCDI